MTIKSNGGLLSPCRIFAAFYINVVAEGPGEDALVLCEMGKPQNCTGSHRDLPHVQRKVV